MKRNTIVEIISALFILLFAYTALNKLYDFKDFENVLRKSPLIGNNYTYLAIGLPVIEMVIALSLLFPRTKHFGLYSSLFLMTIFTMYIGYMIIYTPTLPCNCGGVLKHMSWRQHLIFNFAFTVLAFIGISVDRKCRIQKKLRGERKDIVFT